mmetsp:Transcript_7455/g.16175  ORF Transcript_7455/g.16175 Transcript_7455/m.16175 type:complete len:88 (+) Transcript_7455:758-1021(+)
MKVAVATVAQVAAAKPRDNLPQVLVWPALATDSVAVEKNDLGAAPNAEKAVTDSSTGSALLLAKEPKDWNALTTNLRLADISKLGTI